MQGHTPEGRVSRCYTNFFPPGSNFPKLLSSATGPKNVFCASFLPLVCFQCVSPGAILASPLVLANEIFTHTVAFIANLRSPMQHFPITSLPQFWKLSHIFLIFPLTQGFHATPSLIQIAQLHGPIKSKIKMEQITLQWVRCSCGYCRLTQLTRAFSFVSINSISAPFTSSTFSFPCKNAIWQGKMSDSVSCAVVVRSHISDSE